MIEREALAEAARMNAEHPERRTYRWMARAAADGWEVVRISLSSAGSEDLRTEQRPAEGPPAAEDPRSNYDRNVGGPWVGGG